MKFTHNSTGAPFLLRRGTHDAETGRAIKAVVRM